MPSPLARPKIAPSIKPIATPIRADVYPTTNTPAHGGRLLRPDPPVPATLPSKPYAMLKRATPMGTATPTGIPPGASQHARSPAEDAMRVKAEKLIRLSFLPNAKYPSRLLKKGLSGEFPSLSGVLNAGFSLGWAFVDRFSALFAGRCGRADTLLPRLTSRKLAAPASGAIEPGCKPPLRRQTSSRPFPIPDAAPSSRGRWSSASRSILRCACAAAG